MAKNREQLEAKLQELGSKIVVKEDHNNTDLELFVELEEARLELAKPAKSLESDLEKIATLEAENAELNELLANAEGSSRKRVSFPQGKAGKSTFEVIYPKVNIGGKVYTAQQVADDADLLNGLVKSNSEAVRKV